MIYLPRFLEKNKAEDINAIVHANTGCILFLRVPKQDIYLPRPSTGKENYYYNVLNLYKMYNDYGKFFFWTCIQEKQLPSGLKRDSKYNQRDIDLLRRERKNIEQKYKFVCTKARHLLAHGLLTTDIYSTSNNNRPWTINSIEGAVEKWCYSQLSNRALPNTDEEWSIVAKAICSESDEVYDWIEKWARLWGDCSEEERKKMADRVYYGIWDEYPKSDNCLLTTAQLNERGFGYHNSHVFVNPYKKNDTSRSTFANMLNEQHIKDLSKYLANGVSVSINKNNKTWASTAPFQNQDVLAEEIGFYGIEKLRELLKRKTNENQIIDYYLEGYVNPLRQIMPILGGNRKYTSSGRRGSKRPHFRN